MPQQNHTAARAEKMRQAIKSLEESLRLCRAHLQELETEQHAPDTLLEKMFFKRYP